MLATSVAAVFIQRNIESDETLPDQFMTVAALATFTIVGALLVARRPEHPIGWILAGIGVMSTTFNSFASWGEYQLGRGEHPDAIGMLGLWANGWYFWLLLFLALNLLPVIFPDGRLPSRRWRAWFAIPVLAATAMVVLGALSPTLSGQGDKELVINNPIGITGVPGVEEEAAFLILGILLGMAMAVVAMVVRFRRSHGPERQQLKWFLLVVLFFPFVILGDMLPEQWRFLGNFLFPIALAGLPIAIGVAVLRYRLYDIDRLISRTVSYALLTGVLVGVYALGVLGIGALMPGERSDLLVAGSTLAVAALFRPMRSRIQSVVDRRFNRARYDAARTLETFSSRLRDEVDVDALVADLRQTVAETFTPRVVTAWTRSAPGHST